MVLDVDDILLTSNDIGLLHETKKFLSDKFEMKDFGDASFVLRIEILRDCSQGILGLSQKNYIKKILSRYGMENCRPMDTPVTKGDKFSLKQCPENDLERTAMHDKPYALALGNLMYAQVYIYPDISFIVGVLGRYLSNPAMDHWIAVKHVMRCLKRTKDYMLIYRRSENFGDH